MLITLCDVTIECQILNVISTGLKIHISTPYLNANVSLANVS